MPAIMRMSEAELIHFFMERQPLYRKDPVLYWNEVLQFRPDPWQERAAYDLVGDVPRISIKSGNGVGKTAFESATVLWFLPLFPYARIVATAPTRQQLHDVLWSEIAKWQSNSPLLSTILKWTKTYVYMVGMEKRWFAVAKTATRPENMQGFHADNMMIIIDEGSGVADDIFEALEATLSGGNNKLLVCGNPTKPYGFFHRTHTKDRALYKTHTVNAEHAPQANKANIEILKKKYGPDSNVVRVRVYGEFPLAEDDVFIPLPLLEASIRTDIEFSVSGPDDKCPVSEIHIGCDVARYGSDKTVIGYRLIGTDGRSVVRLHKKIQGQATTRTTRDIILLAEQLRDTYHYTGPIPVKVDDGGVGGGVVDQLDEAKQNDPHLYKWMEVFPMAFGRPIKHKYYYDTTTYMMAVLKSLLMPGGDINQITTDNEAPKLPPDIQLPNDDDLIAQLSVRKYRMTDRSKIVVESKKAMRERDLPSPDEADCVLLLCAPVRVKRREYNWV